MTAAVLSLMIGSSAVLAENYVSWAGGFYISMPDDWEQIDYQTVDVFLISNQAGRDVLDYDAVFAPSSSIPFFTGNYLILTLDTVGELTRTQIDSVLNHMSKTFGRDVKYYPVADFLSDMKSNAPNYDADTRLITVLSDIVAQGKVTKKLMHMTKFYERGLATFYFYSPDSLFDQSKHLFKDIVQSFSTEDIEAAAGHQEVRVADIDSEEATEDNGDEDSLPIVTYIAPIVVIMIIIFAARKKRGKKG
jgi:hypothetical protein